MGRSGVAAVVLITVRRVFVPNRMAVAIDVPGGLLGPVLRDGVSGPDADLRVVIAEAVPDGGNEVCFRGGAGTQLANEGAHPLGEEGVVLRENS